jgi:RNA polymerase sigma factor (sigma-70 family)
MISHAAPVTDELDISLSEGIIQKMEFMELLKIIQTLPTVSKTVFNLYVFEGYSHKEIGKILEISEGTSSWHLHQARNQLQKKINSINADELLYEHKRI